MRDFDAEIAEHEAAIVAIKRERRAERYARVGVMPPVKTAQEYGAEGGLAYMQKYGAMPQGGRRRNPTYEEIMATTGAPSRVSDRTMRPSSRQRPGGLP